MDKNRNVSLDTILESIESLQDKVDALEASSSPQNKETAHHSREINEIAAAMAKAQGEMEMPSLNKSNPYFKSKYTDLAEVLRVARPALAKHNIAVFQNIVLTEDSGEILHTKLMHSSGQWIESRMRIAPPKADVQAKGSYISYIRRYALSSLICVAGSDDDDDGEIVMDSVRNHNKDPMAVRTDYDPREEPHITITKSQKKELEHELNDYPDLAEEILNKMQLQELNDLPQSKFLATIQRIRQLKDARAKQ